MGALVGFRVSVRGVLDALAGRGLSQKEPALFPRAPAGLMERHSSKPPAVSHGMTCCCTPRERVRFLGFGCLIAGIQRSREQGTHQRGMRFHKGPGWVVKARFLLATCGVSEAL